MLPRISTKLVAITLLLLFGAVVNAWMAFAIEHSLANDAYIINHSGIVRGSIQRAVKLELAGKPSEELINKITDLIHAFLRQEGKLRLNGKESEFEWSYLMLETEWHTLRELMWEYRQTPTPELRSRLVESSETCWQLADDIVAYAEKVSSNRLNRFGYLIALALVDIVLFLVILWMVRTYIRGELEVMAQCDSLTGLWNRRAFEVVVETQQQIARREKRSLSLVIMDIDRFKRINDEHGHQRGDEVLKAIADLLTSQFRKVDAVCRIGGEEFVVVLNDTDLERAVELAEKLRQRLEETLLSDLPVTASFGVAANRDDDTVRSLLSRADQALYRAKEAGRNRVEGESGSL
jgi:diguanylate cyclase (GGDEF)-like protein